MPAPGQTRNWRWMVLRGLFVVVIVLAVFGPYLARRVVGVAPLVRLTVLDSVLIWLVGAGILVFGLLEIGLGFRLKDWQDRWTRPLKPLTLEPVREDAGAQTED